MVSVIRLLFGITMGGLLGWLIGLLLAPRSGAETREMIRREWDARLDESKEQVGSQASSLKEKALQVSSELEATGRRFLESREHKKPESASADTPEARH